MQAHTGFRARFMWIALAIVAIALGIGSRTYGGALPPFLATYAGDTLWAMLVYALAGAVAPRARLRTRAFCALTFAFAIEFSQLIKVEWLDATRQTRLALVRRRHRARRGGRPGAGAADMTLALLIVVPLAAGLLALVPGRGRETRARVLALAAMLLDLGLADALWLRHFAGRIRLQRVCIERGKVAVAKHDGAVLLRRQRRAVVT